MDICHAWWQMSVAVQKAITFLQSFNPCTVNTVCYNSKFSEDIAWHICQDTTSSEFCKISFKLWKKRNGHLPLWQCHLTWVSFNSKLHLFLAQLPFWYYWWCQLCQERSWHSFDTFTFSDPSHILTGLMVICVSGLMNILVSVHFLVCVWF